jgi:dolichol-phosphate mannosyltransferase
MPELIVPLSEGTPPSLALVIPTFNEAANVGPLLQRATEALAGIAHEIIVVDDYSNDGTADFVGEAMQRLPLVRLIIRKEERGLASAVVRGWQASEATVLGVMDADLQHPPELLPQLWARIQDGADLALASRYVKSASLGDWSMTRRVLSVLGIWSAAYALPKGRRVHDPASGFFLVRREAIADVPLVAQGFKLLLEVLVRGNIRRVDEVPFNFGTRQGGKSKGNAGVLLDYFALLWKLRRLAGVSQASEASRSGSPQPKP